MARSPAPVTPRDSSATSQPLRDAAFSAASSTEAGLVMLFLKSSRPGPHQVLVEVCRTPGPGSRCASAWAVVVFPCAPVISIIGRGTMAGQYLPHRFVMGYHRFRSAASWQAAGAPDRGAPGPQRDPYVVKCSPFCRFRVVPRYTSTISTVLPVRENALPIPQPPWIVSITRIRIYRFR